MPELTEVEAFRRLLLPLVSSNDDDKDEVVKVEGNTKAKKASIDKKQNQTQTQVRPLLLERLSLEKTPPRKFLNDDEIDTINNGNYYVSDVLRKGKLLCMVLKKSSSISTNEKQQQQKQKKKEVKTKANKKVKSDINDQESSSWIVTQPQDVCYIFIHMGMTGLISTPDRVYALESQTSKKEYPPKSSFLKLTCGNSEVIFSDTRKFGSVLLRKTLDEGFGDLAPDAFHSLDPSSSSSSNSMSNSIDSAIEKLSGKSMGIKAMLLDQSRIFSGVGNWIADEVLYQTKIHPDQTHLTTEQAKMLVDVLYNILSTSINCYSQQKDFPKSWLFHYRWQKGSSKGKKITDSNGKTIDFITSGGRTSAIVPCIQKKRAQEVHRKTKTCENPTSSVKPPKSSSRADTGKDCTSTSTPNESQYEKRGKKRPSLEAKEGTGLRKSTRLRK